MSPVVSVERRTPVEETFRVARVQGMFDLPRRGEDVFRLEANLPLDERPWQVGLITGASGSGKSSIAREAFETYTNAGDFRWDAASLVDDFPSSMSPQDITNLLTAVGFSSVPAWLRPYRVLSTGQQFRADLARSLTGLSPDVPVVFDEFTSTVDRTVAKAVSVSAAKHVRRTDGRFVAVTCHKDIAEWLEPDWTFDTDTQEFSWGSVQPRPVVTLDIREGAREAWSIFRQHHYLTGDINRSARVFLTYVRLGDDELRLAGFFALLPVAGHKGWWRGHRTVVLPDFQGIGIGNRMVEVIAEQLWQGERKRFRSTTSAPGLVAHRRRHSKLWRLAEGPKMKPPAGRTSGLSSKSKRLATSAGRLTTNWVYLPEELR